MRIAYDKENQSLRDIDRRKEAILIKDLAVISVYEYALSKMVVYCYNSYILVLEKWQIMK